MRLVSAATILLHRVREERGVLLLLFSVVAFTSLLVAGAPRVLDRVADEGLRHEAALATPIQRNLQFTAADIIQAGSTDPFQFVAARGAALRGDLAPSIARIVSDDRFVIDTARLGLQAPPRFATYLTLHQQTGIEDLVTLTAGRWPARVASAATTDAGPRIELEILLSDATAATIGADVGDRLLASFDPSDPLLADGSTPNAAAALDVVGRFTVRDPAAPDWFNQRNLEDAAIGGTDNAPIAYASAVFAPSAYEDLFGFAVPMRYQWNLFVDPARLDSGDLERLVADLVHLGSAHARASRDDPGAPVVQTGLRGIITRYRAERATTEAALGLVAIGPLAVAAGALAMLGILVVARRRSALRLARSRGASTGQILAAQLFEGLLVTVPAALLGAAVAATVVGGDAGPLSSDGAIVVALVTTLLLLAATWPTARRARRDLERDDPSAGRPSARRLVAEVLIVGMSLVAVWLLRERGLSIARAGGRPSGFDPFLAAAPMLAGLAVGVIIVRLYPIPIRGLGWITSHRRDLVPVLGLRSLARHPSAGYLPLLILTLTMAIGTLSTVVEASLVRSQTLVSWQDVGADYRIDGLAPGASIRPAVERMPGVGALANGLIVPDSTLSTDPVHRSRMLVEAVDPLGYDAILAGSPVPTSLASTLRDWPTDAGAGSSGSPIPAILSTALPPARADLAMGEAFVLTMRGQTLHFRVAGRSDAFPGVAAGVPFVIVPLPSVLAGWHGTPPSATSLFVGGDGSLGPGLLSEVGPTHAALVTSRYARFDALHDAPLVGAAVGGFGAALLVAAAYMALAIVTVVALEARRRSREMAFLRTIGLSGRQVGLLTVVEQGTPVILALLLGVAVGLALAWLVTPGLDLAAFSGTSGEVTIEVAWPPIALVALLVLTVVAVVVAASSWVAGRRDVGPALRIGE